MLCEHIPVLREKYQIGTEGGGHSTDTSRHSTPRPRRVRSRIRYDLGNVSSMCGKEEMDKRPRISPWITDPHIGSPLSLVLGTTYTYSM